jgi:diaminohydroxyphosphoribosylaminopyrimidine deaminase / 5-amino-6-(5-phosphoribosylamino)uracil reductase
VTPLATAAAGAEPLAESALDERFMRMALGLGERHLGTTWPNPSVGALVVRGEGGAPLIVGQGVTGAGGRPHAERQALAGAGDAAGGATLYVSLEPCAHHGRTPPCVDAIIPAGIARVVTALEDPDPRVSGRGHARLRAAGITVTTGILADEARRSHRGHIRRIRDGRPAATLKLARTADGFASRLDGPRLMITGEALNARVHLMRAHADAILVGVGTVLADDPLLTVRLPGLEKRSPVRVILDSRLRTPANAQVVTGAGVVPTWVVAADTAPVAAEQTLSAAGVTVLRVGTDDSRHLDVRQALALLAERGITRVFTEGGPSLADCFARLDALDEVVVSTAPVPLGEPGRPAIGRDLREALDTRFRPIGSEMVGIDRMDAYERAGA